MALYRPAFSCAIFIHIFAIEQLFAAHIRYFFVNQTAINYFVATILVIAVVSSATLKKSQKLKLPKELAIYLSLLALVSISTTWSKDPTSLHQIVIAAPYICSSIMVMLVLRYTNDLKGFTLGLVVIGLPLVLAIAMSPYFGVRGIRIPWALDQYGNHLLLNYLQIGFSAGVLLISASRPIGVFPLNLDRVVRLAAAVLAIYVLVKSGARGQTVFAIAAVVLASAIDKRLQPKHLITLVILSGSFILISFEFVSLLWEERGSNRWSSEKLLSDTNGRLEIAFEGLAEWQGGVITLLLGLGYYSIHYSTGSYPHVVPLEVLAEEGLVGFLLLFSLTISFGVKLTKLLRRPSVDGKLRASNFVLAAMFLFSFLLIFKQGTVLANNLFFLFGLLICVEQARRRTS